MKTTDPTQVYNAAMHQLGEQDYYLLMFLTKEQLARFAMTTYLLYDEALANTADYPGISLIVGKKVVSVILSETLGVIREENLISYTDLEIDMQVLLDTLDTACIRALY